MGDAAPGIDAADCSTFLREMTSWPPSWNYDVLREIRLRRCTLNFIPIRFQTTEP